MISKHVLRHTFERRCIEDGELSLILKIRLRHGHTNIHIALDIYAYVFARMNAGTVAQQQQYIETIS